MRRTVLISLISEADRAGIRGVLWATRGAWLVLRNAELCKAVDVRAPDEKAAIPSPGEVVIHRSNVAYLQVLSPA